MDEKMNSPLVKQRNLSSHNRIQRALRSYKILADTSFIMQPGFAEFAVENSHLIGQNPMLISNLVLDELHRLSGSQNTQKQSAAKRALAILADLLRRGYVEVRHEVSDKYVDLVIQRVVEQHLLTHDFLVLTNDVGLMEDLYVKKQKRSVRSSHDLIVAKLHGASQKLKIFIPNGNPLIQACKSPAHISSSCVFPKPFATTTTLSCSSGIKLGVRKELDTGARVQLSDGSVVTLDKKLAHGGEGTVFEIAGRDEVCKIYHRDKLTSDREQKVRLMLTRKLSDPAICWPSALIFDQDKLFRGYAMSRASGKPLAHGLFIPKSWLEEKPAWNRRHSVRLAINIIERIFYLHQLNVLLGDINPLNILTKDENTIYLVDTDSYQIEGFPCPVGTVNFTAPEIQGEDFRTFLRRPEHELFAVATLLFMILMPGKTPYSHQGGESGYLNIQEMHFPYPFGENHANGAPLGPWRFCWSHLTFGIKEAFYRSFHRDRKQEPRVTLSEWLRLLRDYKKLLELPEHAFSGPKRQIGFDLSVLPQNLRIVAGQKDVPEDDGQTDMQKEFRKIRLAPVQVAFREREPAPFVSVIRSSVSKPASTKSLTPARQQTVRTRPITVRPGKVHKYTVTKKSSAFLKFLKRFF
ncbi:MAG: hypothetical protein ABSE89_11230 [Sedimentisphaerales bacterium]